MPRGQFRRSMSTNRKAAQVKVSSGLSSIRAKLTDSKAGQAIKNIARTKFKDDVGSVNRYKKATEHGRERKERVKDQAMRDKFRSDRRKEFGEAGRKFEKLYRALNNVSRNKEKIYKAHGLKFKKDPNVMRNREIAMERTHKDVRKKYKDKMD